MPIVAKQRVYFGPFELDAHAGELSRDGLKLKLQGHPIQILAMLLERPGELVTREEIQQKLWPSESETFVDFEHGLNTAMRKLRQALGDEAETPQYIETLPRRGYRFVGNVAASEATAAHQESTENGPMGEADKAEATEDRASSKRRRWLLMAGLVLLVAAGSGLMLAVKNGGGSLEVETSRQLTHNGSLGLITGTAEQFGSIETDGRRVYFTALLDNSLRYVSVGGGTEGTLASPVKNPIILHISPDGSQLIVRETIGAGGRSEAPLWLVEANGGTARKLGDVVAQDAAFAPDGKTIVLAIGNTLYVTDVQGTRPAKLADLPGRAFWLRWSPDGRQVRFSVIDQNAIEATLWEIKHGGTPRQVLKDWKNPAKVCCGVCCGTWTADGKNFLFRSGSQYWAIREKGWWPSNPTPVTSGGMNVAAATTSPLSRTLFVNANLERWESLRLDERAQQVTPINGELRPTGVEYSPDGKWIAYLRRGTDSMEVWRARADGSERRQLTTWPVWTNMVRWSPDGNKLALMAAKVDGPWKIYWMDAQGGELHELPSPPVNQGDPNWSPDGDSILFGQPPESWVEPGVQRRLYQYDLRTGKTAELAGSEGLFSPRWSPDGKYVVAMRVDFKGMSVLNRETGEWRELTHQSTDSPFWSRDSRWVYFNDFDDVAMWRVALHDHRLERVMGMRNLLGFTVCAGGGVAPDGTITLNCNDKQADLFALQMK